MSEPTVNITPADVEKLEQRAERLRMLDEHEIDLAGLEKLREPFPPEQIGQLPKPTKKDATKGDCTVCGKWHGLPAVHLDYVGHAAVTDRLREVDPLWNWEPAALDDRGAPLIQRGEGRAVMWIRLTVCGVTRLGVGIAPAGKDEVEKELISDAIRNAAMRFGVALDLWSKEVLGSDDGDEGSPGVSEPESIASTEDHDAVKTRIDALDTATVEQFNEWKAGQSFVWHPGYDVDTIVAINRKLDELGPPRCADCGSERATLVADPHDATRVICSIRNACKKRQEQKANGEAITEPGPASEPD